MGTWGDRPDVKPRGPGRHRRPRGRHRGKGCAAMCLALGSVLAALAGGVVLGLVMFTALILL